MYSLPSLTMLSDLIPSTPVDTVATKNQAWSSGDQSMMPFQNDSLIQAMKASFLKRQQPVARKQTSVLQCPTTSIFDQVEDQFEASECRMAFPRIPAMLSTKREAFHPSGADNIFDHPLIKGLQATPPSPDRSCNRALDLLDRSLDLLYQDDLLLLDDEFPAGFEFGLEPTPFAQAPLKRKEADMYDAPKPKRQRKNSDVAPRFRPYQEKQWVQQFQELLAFKAERGHSLVPHTFDENPTLSRWVKRQRYQYKLKQEGAISTMTVARIKQLEDAGFVWDSHAAAWKERLCELKEYKRQHGNCIVPSSYPKNPQLATWVKCQRRQGKLFSNGKPSNMTLERVGALNQLGFSWGLRHQS